MMEGKDLGAIFDAHIKAEFVDRDVAETMATMTPEPYLTHVPTLTGGTGRSEVERFYREHFVGHWPDDVQVKSVSRTVGQHQVVDELIVSFTHDREMRVYLPGVAPTGRKVVLPHVVVMGFDEGGRVAHEHIYWDQASLLVQVGLLDPALLPVSGANQAKRLLDPDQPANEMIERRRLKANVRFWGVKRTLVSHSAMSAFDPKRTPISIQWPALHKLSCTAPSFKAPSGNRVGEPVDRCQK